MNRGEELGDGPAPLADFGHGSLFEGAPGPRRFCATAELSRRSHFMPIEICMESDGLHAYFDRRQVIRSRAAAGSAKPPTRKRSEKSALMASVWGKLWTPYRRGSERLFRNSVIAACDRSELLGLICFADCMWIAEVQSCGILRNSKNL